MIVRVTARHMDVTEALKKFAEDKAGKLTRYYDLIKEIEVVFNSGKDRTSVEMIVYAEHRDKFVANHENGDAYACVDACVHKLERQLTDHKKKFRNRKHPSDETPTARGGMPRALGAEGDNIVPG